MRLFVSPLVTFCQRRLPLLKAKGRARKETRARLSDMTHKKERNARGPKAPGIE